MKIAFFDIKGWEEPIIKKRLKGHIVKFFHESLSEAHLAKIKNCEVISGFIDSKFPKQIIDQLPKLKLIATRSTGFDHIDINECKKKRITVINVPSYGENTVAEHTFALILALSRNIHKSYMRVQRNDFSIDGLKGFDLQGKTLGVVGTGRIGRHVIKIARAFEMEVLAFDKFPNKQLASELDFSYVSLSELLKKSDIVSLHIPYMRENHHLINRRVLNMMKKGALLINTSRGALVDTAALLEALDKEKLAGAGLDVLEGEELIKEEKQLLYDSKKLNSLSVLVKDHLLLARENVVFTPHIAFYSSEALVRIIEQTLQNILDFRKNQLKKECIVV